MTERADDHLVQLGFLTKAFPQSDSFDLLGVLGREEISRPFEYELLLSRPGPPLTNAELEDIVREPCVIALGPKAGDLVHGILTSIEHVDTTRNVASIYVGTMVPMVSLLDLGRRSAVYQETTIAKVVEDILTSYGMTKGTSFDMLVSDTSKSPKHEYIVQYQESDWAFIQRWLEHEGFFYWFEHGPSEAKLVIADSNDDATLIKDPPVIAYRERNNLGTGGEPTVWNFGVRQRRVPQKVTTVDYNYRRPNEMLLRSHTIDQAGFGHVFYYGDHFKDMEMGAGIAKLRAEELAAERRVVSGETDCSRFRVGHVFELENHHHAAYDGKYLITSIEHRAGMEVPSRRRARGVTEEQAIPSGYRASFTAIPLSTPFRPRRVTPRPRIYGIINGHIEADSSGDYAEIDASGRYKVKLPFDVGTKRGRASSRWIRMAQSYAGAGYGIHFPLHKGTEVLIAHIDGDPDRPVIVGAVPNAVTPGPVVDANATQSVMQTASGVRVEIEDLQS